MLVLQIIVINNDDNLANPLLKSSQSESGIKAAKDTRDYLHLMDRIFQNMYKIK